MIRYVVSHINHRYINMGSVSECALGRIFYFGSIYQSQKEIEVIYAYNIFDILSVPLVGASFGLQPSDEDTQTLPAQTRKETLDVD